MGELLFVFARIQVSGVQDSQDLIKAHREAIETLQRIARFYRPLPATQLWLAVSHEHLGDNQSAKIGTR